MASYTITNGRSSSYPRKHYGGQFAGTTATFCEEGDLVDAVPAEVLALPTTPVTVLHSGGPLTCSPKFFGISIKDRENDALIGGPKYWTVRSHDLGNGKGRWQKIQPTSGTWDFADLDQWVNTHYQAGRDLIFTLFGPPAWAVELADRTEQGIYGPSNLGMQAVPNPMSLWSTYCTTIATRYLGKIKYYEVWNEPNYNNDGTGVTALGLSSKAFFYSGTWTELAQLTRLANQAIKAVDPTAKIISPAITVWSPTASQTAEAYMIGMLAASDGATGTMKDWVDIIGVHLYTTSLSGGNTMSGLSGMIDRINAAKTTAGVSAKETWDTESAPIFIESNNMTDAEWKTFMGRFLLTCICKGISRTIYYQLDHASMGIMTRNGLFSYWDQWIDDMVHGRITYVCRLNVDGRIAYQTASGLHII